MNLIRNSITGVSGKKVAERTGNIEVDLEGEVHKGIERIEIRGQQMTQWYRHVGFQALEEVGSRRHSPHLQVFIFDTSKGWGFECELLSWKKMNVEFCQVSLVKSEENFAKRNC